MAKATTREDFLRLGKAMSKILAPKTTAAYAAVFDIAIDPKSESCWVALTALERVWKTLEVQDLIIARCAAAPCDVEVWERPLGLLCKIVHANKSRLASDPRVVKGLRRYLEWEDGNEAANAADALGALPHPPSLPLVMARLARSGSDDDVLVWSVAQAFPKLGGTAADLAKLQAARARLRDKDTLVDKELAKLEKRFATGPRERARGAARPARPARRQPRR